MARSRSRRSSGGGLPLVLGTLALLLLFGVIGFAAYVYFFVPPDEENGNDSGNVVQANVAAAPTPTLSASVVYSGTAATPAGSQPRATPASGASGSPTPRGGTALPTPSGSGPTPTTGAPLSGTLTYRSTQFPYSLSYPETWSPRPGGVKVGNLTADAFLGQSQSGFTPSITLYAQPVAAGVESETFALTNLQSLGAGGIQAQAQPESVPPGARAMIVKYPVSSGELRYNVTQVLFVQQGMGWVVTLSTPLADNGSGLAALRQMLASFRSERPG
ncbi:MAG: hypothetical protein M1370_07740 [Bacteroidetes bacterium]|nr:hypothetical protein [Bacteroidota bacterium]MCL5026271.1 hypothetical protein [Chloroflexota bacterium]